ncbi:thiamine phosphate synthase [Candidatus Magnetomonas plexicatena]|uniref:thiamine phosphate synthase n=1 Tax=Candidatus Magnetomonas plexicatena TaxID=2552947 RepID=UPI001C77946E|nr:thiamine phosphate synthase [Nitrospirales bacterium LBB_01]
MASIDFKLYLISDRSLINKPCCDVLEEALMAGVGAIQLREKDLNIKEIMVLAEKLRILTKKYNAKLFINDRVDVALAIEADGVHLTHNSIPILAARKIAGERLIIAQSTHSLEEAVSAQSKGADFITLGPIYETSSKLQFGPPIGALTITKVKKKVKIPVFAIGGIKTNNISEVLESGADGVAVISGILSSTDVFGETKKYLELLK